MYYRCSVGENQLSIRNENTDTQTRDIDKISKLLKNFRLYEESEDTRTKNMLVEQQEEATEARSVETRELEEEEFKKKKIEVKKTKNEDEDNFYEDIIVDKRKEYERGHGNFTGIQRQMQEIKSKMEDMMEVLKSFSMQTVNPKREWQIFIRDIQAETHTEDIIKVLKENDCDVLFVTERNNGSQKCRYATVITTDIAIKKVLVREIEYDGRKLYIKLNKRGKNNCDHRQRPK